MASGGSTRVVFVTGAGSGIGRATALLALERGYAIVAVDRDEAGLAQTAERAANADRLLTIVTDVIDAAAVDAAAASAVERFGRLDVLIAAAGLGTTGRIDAVDAALWDQIMDVTLKGSSNCCRAAIPRMRAGGGGSIVLFGSVLGRAVTPGVGAYAAAKAGIEGLVRTLAVDHAAEGIRVNCIAPGSTDTPMMWLGIAPEKIDEARRVCEEDIPLARVADALELARPILFLASDEASFVTGTTLVVDGGVLAKLASRL
jgi:NAD(P)-dependent dehydrogenase (short-subunit alcohol dehydrogenase family)